MKWNELFGVCPTYHCLQDRVTAKNTECYHFSLTKRTQLYKGIALFITMCSWHKPDISSPVTFPLTSISGFHITITSRSQYSLTASNVFHLQLNGLLLIHICSEMWLVCVSTKSMNLNCYIELSDQGH